MKKFIERIKESRKRLKDSRLSFWNENKANFKKNVKRIIDLYSVPKDWKVYVAASNFLFDKQIFPFDYESWSSTNLISATKKQGFEVMIFLNKARLEFLSFPALIPIVEHEMVHVMQAARNPKRYLKSMINDSISKKLEIEAEEGVKHISDEFRRQWVLESVVYCYDLDGWELAKKMADFFHEEMENMYGGGYDKGMTDEEYELFLIALRGKDIDLFIEGF